jgi:hypothetical protein
VCFCCAAKHAFQLFLRNTDRFSLVSIFAVVFIFIGELAIGIGVAFICYLIMVNWDPLNKQLYSYICPTIVLL